MAPTSSSTADREIVITRTFDAPRALVFKAFTDPRHVDHWWGPKGFRNTTLSMDVRPGGMWRYIMHGPNGRDFANRVVYTLIKEPEHLEYDHGEDTDGRPASFHVTVTFEEQDGRTTLTMRSLFPSAEARDHVVKEFGAIEGGRQTLDRLAVYLEAMEG
jgi:uncharacterized protein YndB with AHSA1/START domain